MTKVIILGENNTPKETKHIVFEKYLDVHLNINKSASLPIDWNNVELICKNHLLNNDLMFAYNTNRSSGILYIGQFNDGTVE